MVFLHGGGGGVMTQRQEVEEGALCDKTLTFVFKGPQLVYTRFPHQLRDATFVARVSVTGNEHVERRKLWCQGEHRIAHHSRPFRVA